MNLAGMKHFAQTDIVDAVVIGTGAGGAPLLAKLAKAGLSVVALEAGRNWTPEDFAADETAAADLYWLGERLSDGAMPNAFGANNSGTGVGGSTLHWGAFVPRPQESDLRLRSMFGVGEDWPFGVAELLPYLQAVETIIGVSGPPPIRGIASAVIHCRRRP
jgi:choline dehydrogenase-like flavoprotein